MLRGRNLIFFQFKELDMKINFKRIILICFSGLLCGCNTKLSITTDGISGVQDIHTEYQNQYINGDYTTTNYTKLESWMATSDYSYPKPVVLSWKSTEELFKVHVSENEDFSSSWIFETTKQTFNLYNLKINTTYFYKIESILGKRSLFTKTYSFQTIEKGPRNLFIENVTNSRDIGGNKIKQGLVYRTSSFNSFNEETISEFGLKTIKEQLGVKTDIDLRRKDDDNGMANITSSPLGEDVKFYSIPMNTARGGNMLTYKKDEYDNPQAIRDIFEVLKDENNYPLAIHCSRGVDRTGLIAFLLEGLLGEDEEYLVRDYLFSYYGNINGSIGFDDIMGNREARNKYGYYLIDYPNGESMSEKFYNCLVEEIKVPSTSLDAVINILRA